MTVTALFLEQAARLGDRPALRSLRSGGADRDETLGWADWAERSRAFGAALVAAGVERGGSVAILAGNRVEWPVADLGSLLAGCVGVGIYPTSAPAQVAHILRDSAAAVVVVDTPEQRAKVDVALAELEARPIVVGPEAGGGVARSASWAAWLERGCAALADPAVAGVLERRSQRAVADDVALLIYTSGSTGRPKGARISHRYLLASARSIRDTLGLTASDTTLSFLPYCHAAERVFGLYTRILCGMECGLVPDHARLWDAALEYGPTLFGGLPRFYEKVYEALEAERQRTAGPEREGWDRALELGRRRSRAARSAQAGAGQGGTGPLTADAESEWARVVAAPAARLRSYFGGRIRLATSGGATLNAEVAEYLDALGLTVLGAYGLTEHLCAAFNRPGRYSFDSAGPPMPGTSLRLDDDGEILIRRSDLTFAGYRGLPEATRSAFTIDGEWLRTGDLGEIDARGFLRITGRKKEVIALSTGKKVAPVPIEARLAEDPWIEHAVLFGESRKFVTALLTLRRPAVEAWARGRGLGPGLPGSPGGFAALLSHPEVLARVQAAVDAVNADLSRSERVRKFVLLERGLSLDEDELTPTMKVRRGFVTARFRDRLDALYTVAE